MKKFIQKLVGGFMLMTFVLSACKEDMASGYDSLENNTEIRFSLGTRQPLPDSNLNSDSEIKLVTVRIYAFTGDEFDCMKFFNVPVDQQIQGFFTESIIVKAASNKRLIAIINEPASAKEYLDKANTIDQIRKQRYLIADYVDGNATNIKSSGLPMYGDIQTNLFLVDATLPVELSIPVERAVARVDLYMRSEDESHKAVSLDTEFNVALQNSVNEGYLSPALVWNTLGADIAFAPLQATKTLTDSPVSIVSIYVSERGFVTGKPMKLKLNNVSVGGVLKSYAPLVIGVAADGTTYDEDIHGDAYRIKRNHVYRMTVTVSNTNKLPVEITVIPWGVEEDNSDLYPKTRLFPATENQ